MYELYPVHNYKAYHIQYTYIINVFSDKIVSHNRKEKTIKLDFIHKKNCFKFAI